jgi:hypothetical protein
MCRKCADRRYARTGTKERLEKTPAIWRHTSQVESQLAEGKTLDPRTTFSNESFTELPPPTC